METEARKAPQVEGTQRKEGTVVERSTPVCLESEAEVGRDHAGFWGHCKDFGFYSE